MKNAAKHATALKALQKKLLKEHKPGDRPQVDPLRALVLGVLGYDAPDDKVAAAMDAFDREFIDINELRVATELELQDLMGEEYPNVLERATRLRDLLMALFDKEGHLTLGRICALARKEQRQASRELVGATPFIEAHLCLLGFGAPAMPVDGSILNYLIAQEAVDPEATAEEAQKFVEAQLKADEIWPFFFACREAALAATPAAAKPKPAKPAAAKEKVSKKTTKKAKA